tara:strand:- start:44 stop:283 length:240 start_codon:yes stop_codon:yes gene_type:complete
MKLTKSQLKQLIKEELSEYMEYEGELTPEQQNVTKLCEQLTEAIYDMGEGSADMVDTYLVLFRALANAGLNIKYMAQMV